MIAATCLLVLAIGLGGASRFALLQLTALQLATLPLLCFALLGGWRKLDRTESAALLLLAAIFVVPLIQLIPLPPDMWRRLPGRGDLAATQDLAGIADHWAPLTLAPEATARSALFLLTPATMFVVALRLSSVERLRLAGVAAGLAVASLALGLAQLAGGEPSPLLIYPLGNSRDAVGFFANQNHQASLLLCAMPLTAVWALELAREGRASRGVALGAYGLLVSLVIIGLGAVKSRAGLVLCVPALVGSLIILWRGGLGAPIRWLLVGVLGAGSLAFLLVAWLGSAAILERFQLSLAEDDRLSAFPTIVQAASRFAPAGSGLGTFEPVYQMEERLELIEENFLNHAHNDYLEIWLETGWLGSAVLIACLAWVAFNSFRTWRRPPSREVNLARAGTIAIALLLAHSGVDYPLRTPALATLFAFACALLAGVDRKPVSERRRPRPG